MHSSLTLASTGVSILTEEQAKATSPFVLAMRNGESLSASAFARLWRIIENRTTDDPGLLGKTTSPRHPNTVYTLDFHVHPHLLRHTCITRWVEEGFDLKEVQYLAGHSTPDMTLRVYAHYDQRIRLENTAAKIRASTCLSAHAAAEVQHFSAPPVAP